MTPIRFTLSLGLLIASAGACSLATNTVVAVTAAICRARA